MMFRFFLYTFFTVIFLFTGASQTKGQDIPIGDWRTHLPFNKVIDVAVAGDLVFAATDYGMFTYNTNDNSVERFDKVNGLSDVGISKIGYNRQVDALLIAYTSTNMDIVRSNGSIINISDIRDKDILGKKTINNIMFKDDFAYLSCGFGIVVLDMVREEIHDTYYIGPDGGAIDVFDMAFNDTSFYAATEKGVYYADIKASNLADFNQWHKDMSMIHPELTYNLIQSFSGKIIANYYNGGWEGDTLFVFNGQKWDYFEKTNSSRHFQLFTDDKNLNIVNRYSITVYDKELIRTNTIWSINGNTFEPLSMDKTNDEFIWIGDAYKGLIKNWNTTSGEYIKPNGPYSVSVFDMDAGGKDVWVAPGGHQGDWSKLYKTDGVFSFLDNLWYTHRRPDTEAFDTITDMVCVKVDPLNTNNVYVGTWGKGLVKFVDNALQTIFTNKNSSLQTRVVNPSQILISGLDFDDQHNLWVVNTSAADILSVMKNNGEWRSFNLGGAYSGIDVTELMVDAYNQKWIMKRSEGFLIVFTDNGTIDNPTDDQVKLLGNAAGNGNIPGSKVYSFATDLDGEVWVGTDAGVCVFYSPDNIFEPGQNYDAQQVLVPRNDGTGLADILLESEKVTAITIDGANRKWIGTERAGVFLLSDDGIEQLAHFTTTNSPLLSNNISSIAINSDGEVFFGTAGGIISFRGTATPDGPQSSGVYAFPNPVRENYTGVIAIKGVVNNSSVKITDTYGNLVFETRSEGSQAIWDGYNFDGRRAATGVYLVFITNDDGSEKMATKILVIR